MSSRPARARTDPESPLEVEGNEKKYAEHHQIGQQAACDARTKPGPAEQGEIRHR